MTTRLYILAVFLLAVNGMAAPHYVSLVGTNNSPYTNWPDAATNIQWAVNVATNGETVWVSNGVYVLTNQIVITNGITLQSIAGHGPNDTIINGGYAVGNLLTNRCLLMSNTAAFVSGLTFSNGASFTNGGGGAQIFGGIMSNCTVCNNWYFHPGTNNINPPHTGGGGIWMSAGTVTVCTISANIATNCETQTGAAGIFFRNAGTLVSSCIISNNKLWGLSFDTNGGGGAYGCGFIMYNGAQMKSSMICNNSYPYGGANGYCGGGYIEGSACVMDSCTVTVNQAGYMAGVQVYDGTITNCVISYNTANQYCGALQLGTLNGPGRVYNTQIIGNTSAGNHGVIRINANTGAKGLELTMANCRIVSNQPSSKVCLLVSVATNFSLLNSEVSSSGLGVYFSGASGKMQDCLVANNSNSANSTYRGGGVVIGGAPSPVLISGCTIVGNVDTNRAQTGCGLRFAGSNIGSVVSSCVIYSNGIGGTDDVFDASAPTNYGTLQYSCVGTNPGFTGAGIIVANPQFNNFAGGNYRLGPNSPCINTGSNESWMINGVDLDGLKRIWTQEGIVDMGCYEYGSYAQYPYLILGGSSKSNVSGTSLSNVIGSSVQ